MGGRAKKDGKGKGKPTPTPGDDPQPNPTPKSPAKKAKSPGRGLKSLWRGDKEPPTKSPRHSPRGGRLNSQQIFCNTNYHTITSTVTQSKFHNMVTFKVDCCGS